MIKYKVYLKFVSHGCAAVVLASRGYYIDSVAVINYSSSENFIKNACHSQAYSVDSFTCFQFTPGFRHPCSSMGVLRSHRNCHYYYYYYAQFFLTHNGVMFPKAISLISRNG